MRRIRFSSSPSWPSCCESNAGDPHSFRSLILCPLRVDYYAISKGLVDIEQLYTGDRHGKYWYTYGINWRAIVAYLVGVAINFAGQCPVLSYRALRTAL